MIKKTQLKGSNNTSIMQLAYGILKDHRTACLCTPQTECDRLASILKEYSHVFYELLPW